MEEGVDDVVGEGVVGVVGEGVVVVEGILVRVEWVA